MARSLFRLGLVLCLSATSCAEPQPPPVGSRRPRRPRPRPVVVQPARPAPTSAVPMPAAPIAAPAQWPAGYHTFTQLSAALHELADGAADATKFESIATTAGGRELWTLQIAAPGDVPPENRQAILIVGGTDADHPAGSVIAVNVARLLVEALATEPDGEVAALLARRTVYVVPRLNPDGIESFFETIKRGARANAKPIDNDRDGVVNEDGPNDLNSDSRITVMRVRDPDGPWMVDPDEPRLMKKADRAKGERGVYKLMTEGLDDDGDGQINEDGPGGVDVDRNWPHLFESGVKEVGIHQLSEPETRALADFILARPNIVAAVVYGRHDNIVKVPKGKQRGPAGRAYRDLHPDDVKLYEHLSKKYRKTTGLEESPGGEADGAFYSWSYAQRGILTLATSPWWPLEKEEKKKPTTQPASGPAGEDPDEPKSDEDAAPDDAPSVDSEEQRPPDRDEIRARFQERFGNRQPTQEEARAFFRSMSGGTAQVRVQRGGGPAGASQRGRGGRGGRGGQRPRGRPGAPGDAGAPSDKPDKDPLAGHVEASKVNKRWLKYSDEKREGRGFVEWTEFDHPTLGKVEIGGFAPYFKTTPPADKIDPIAEKQVAFLVELSELFAAPRFAKPEVKDVGGGVWRIKLGLTNDGYLPTHPAIARHLRMPGFAVRPQVEADRLIGGRPQVSAANLEGSGGSVSWQWLIRGQAGESVEFRAFNRVYGEIKTSVVLRETPPGGEGE